MEQNNNGRGVFYGVIGVATLVVAIIGATFAYFSASTNSNVDAVSAASSSIQNLTLTDDSLIRSNLIPVLTSGVNADKFPTVLGFVKTGNNQSCIDLDGNEICSMYTFEVTNPNAQAQYAYFTLNVNTNEFTNLMFAVFKGKPADGTGYSNVNGTATADTARSAGANALVVSATNLKSITTGSTTGAKLLGNVGTDGEATILLNNLTQLLPANGTAQYTIVTWIEETSGPQNETDANKNFAAGVTISTADPTAAEGSINGVTGILTARS